jgi:hypothetical protein
MARPTKKEVAMLMKKLTVAAAALAISATAFAEPPRWAPAHGYRGDHYAPHYVVRPAYRHYYYQPAPRVVVVERPAYPAYLVLGAVAGAVIAHELSR